MKKILLGLLLVAAFLCRASLPDALAASYRFTDKEGNVGIADDLASVPEPYRATAVLIGADDLEEKQTTGAVAPSKVPTAATAPAGAPTVFTPPAAPVLITAPGPANPASSAPPGDTPREPFSRRGAISLGVIFGVLLIIVILGQVSALRVRHSAFNAVRMSLLTLLVAYLAYAHFGDVAALFSMAGSKVQAVSDKAAKRGEKAGQAIKAMESLTEQVDQAVKESEEARKGMHEAEKAAGN